MFYGNHNPPHFHARYGVHSASIKIDDFAVLEGGLPPRALGLVIEWIEWAEIHKEELLRDWRLAVENKPLVAIEPLK